MKKSFVIVRFLFLVALLWHSGPNSVRASIQEACKKILKAEGYGDVTLEKRDWGGGSHHGLFECKAGNETYILKVETEKQYQEDAEGFSFIEKLRLPQMITPLHKISLGLFELELPEDGKIIKKPVPLYALLMKKAFGEKISHVQNLEKKRATYKQLGLFLGSLYLDHSVVFWDLRMEEIFLYKDNLSIVDVGWFEKEKKSGDGFKALSMMIDSFIDDYSLEKISILEKIQTLKSHDKPLIESFCLGLKEGLGKDLFVDFEKQRATLKTTKGYADFCKDTLERLNLPDYLYETLVAR